MELVERQVAAAGRTLSLLVPPDPEALLDEHAFEAEEYLPYWAELWPSALGLAEALAGAPLAGRRVLELGCGLGVPSLVAALAGADVLATDWSPEAVRVLRRNAGRVGARLGVRRWSWFSDGDARALGPPWPLVIAADVLYERRNGPPLLAALDALVAPDGEAWIADPGRRLAAPVLERDAPAAGWVVDAVPHDGPAPVTVHRLRRGAAPSG
jgi:predicted nicotinamide N-methyase